MQQQSQNCQKKEDNKYLDNRAPANNENQEKNINKKLPDQNKTVFGTEPKKEDKIKNMEIPYSCISKIQEPYKDISYQKFSSQK